MLALVAIANVSNCRPCVVDRGDGNCSIRKCGAWVGIKPYCNRNWQVGWWLTASVTNGYYHSHGSVDQVEVKQKVMKQKAKLA